MQCSTSLVGVRIKRVTGLTNNTRYPTQEIERNVDEQISAAAALDEDGHGREEEG